MDRNPRQDISRETNGRGHFRVCIFCQINTCNKLLGSAMIGPSATNINVPNIHCACLPRVSPTGFSGLGQQRQIKVGKAFIIA